MGLSHCPGNFAESQVFINGNLRMNAIRLVGRLFIDSGACCAVTSAASWMLPLFVAACLHAPVNLRADVPDWSHGGHGNTNEPAKVESTLSNSPEIPSDDQRHANEEFRAAITQMVDEPAQKEIILYSQGREDVVLQVKYEGPDQAFGWLIPVPGLPEVRQGSMNCFYDLNRLTQEPLWPDEFDESSLVSSRSDASRIKPVEIKTGGAFEVAVLAPQGTQGLPGWLAGNHFSLPKGTRASLESYVTNHWYFIAVTIDPGQSGFALESSARRRSPSPPSASHQTVNVELAPLSIGFPSEKCLALPIVSTVNSNPSPSALFVLSDEPLLSRLIFEKKLKACAREQAEWSRNRPEREKAYYASAEHDRATEEKFLLPGAGSIRGPSTFLDPDDPMPPPSSMAPMILPSIPVPAFSDSDPDVVVAGDVIRSMEAQAERLPAIGAQMPWLTGSTSWVVTKESETLSPEEMGDLDIEPAIPMIAAKLFTPEGRALFACLPQFGKRAVPLVLTGLASGELENRRQAASVMSKISDPRLVAPLAGLFGDPDASIRSSACQAAAWKNWDGAFAPQVVQLLSDPDSRVRWAACNCLEFHRAESKANLPVYQEMVAERGVAALPAMQLLWIEHVPLPKESVLPLLSDPGMFRIALAYLRDFKLEVNDLSPLLTNSSPWARGNGLALLMQIRDRPATARIVSMLRDSDEGVRWTARNALRMFSGEKLGADPAAWEKWWADNQDTFTPTPRMRPPPAHP
jgi:hypothetical protein